MHHIHTYLTSYTHISHTHTYHILNTPVTLHNITYTHALPHINTTHTAHIQSAHTHYTTCIHIHTTCYTLNTSQQTIQYIHTKTTPHITHTNYTSHIDLYHMQTTVKCRHIPYTRHTQQHRWFCATASSQHEPPCKWLPQLRVAAWWEQDFSDTTLTAVPLGGPKRHKRC